MRSLTGIVPSRPPDPEGNDMTRKTVMTAALISTFGLALAACGSTIEQKAATGAVAGAVVAGPVGAAVGGAAGTAVGQATKDD
jgi:hypothetical protein